MSGLEALLSTFAFVWGAVWGSFLNVVIHRLPRGDSVLAPPSHCPFCKKTIRWYHNIPIFSYVVLGGKCADCRNPISVRYPLVELVAAMLSLAVWQVAAYNPLIPSLGMALTNFVFLFSFAMALVAITFIDLDEMIIPDVITLPLLLCGLAYSFVMEPFRDVTFVEALIGALVGSRVITLFIVSYLVVRGRRGMGWGDMKLMGMLGAFLGWKSLNFILLAGPLQGIIYTIPSLVRSAREDKKSNQREGSTTADDEEKVQRPPLHMLALVVLLPELLYLPDRVVAKLFGEAEAEVQTGEEAETVDDELPRSGRFIPFGPFLALAALEWLFFAGWIQDAFYAMFRL
jgi:leader peptidase (prepilin peptidase) / N-methyltransferase